MTKMFVVFSLSFVVFWTSIFEATGFAIAARFIKITNTVAPSQITAIITFAVAVTLKKIILIS